MTRVFIADAKPEERSALRLLLLELKMTVVGQADNWRATLANAPAARPDMLLIEWELLPPGLGAQALAELRLACVNVIRVVLVSVLSARQQAALSSGADTFISKSDSPDRVAERLQAAAKSLTH
jgi:DNA-binding NarL/FixJ family response regulator